MTRMTCSTAGGAISVWINILDCNSHGGIVTTRDDYSPTGSIIHCASGRIK